ncbi:Fibronectin, type III domain protein [Alloactinosynnema sp. L-07]|uniref:fibronectin type III domain-containing protein n=1 Tax=Alloactinosynnema sp. L-07 TaxID=1653480 RepID=UPI00065EEFAC|nr:fibronectin type III domain-containing protein [Alloactinosynnema sp. L-07]CRK60535.1 Fibronectin, type III domain protein [Alloactinosynnema sp. L-07]
MSRTRIRRLTVATVPAIVAGFWLGTVIAHSLVRLPDHRVDHITKLLTTPGHDYLVDYNDGTITATDRISAKSLGVPWRTVGGLADAVVDDAGTVWAIDKSGSLIELTWAGGALTESTRRPVTGIGAESVLMGHQRGATLISPEAGAAIRVGAGTDQTVTVTGLRTPVRTADRGGAESVPVAVEPAGMVIFIRGTQVSDVDVAAVGCDRPGKPAVLDAVTYVPCLGARRVIALGADGLQVRPDLTVPAGGDPILISRDATIVVRVPGSSTDIVIEPDGSTRPVDTRPETSASVAPTGTTTTSTTTGPAAPVTTTGPTATTRPGSAGPQPTTTTQAVPPPPPTTTGTGAAIIPTSVSATARGDGSVLVSWTPGAARPDRYYVWFWAAKPPMAGRPGARQVLDVSGSANSAVVTSLDPGSSGTFFVEADDAPGRSPESNQITTAG